jgi:hypothetical protein
MKATQVKRMMTAITKAGIDKKMPILSNLKFSNEGLTFTNLNTTITDKKEKFDFETLINLNDLKNVLTTFKASDEIEVKEVKEDFLTLNNFNLAKCDLSQYPILQTNFEEKTFIKRFTKNDLKLLSQISIYSHKEGDFYRGLYIYDGFIFATNGIAVARYDFNDFKLANNFKIKNDKAFDILNCFDVDFDCYLLKRNDGSEFVYQVIFESDFINVTFNDVDLDFNLDVNMAYHNEFTQESKIDINKFIAKYEFLVKMANQEFFAVTLIDNFIYCTNRDTLFEYADDTTGLNFKLEQSVNIKFLIQVLNSFKKIGLKEITIRQGQDNQPLIFNDESKKINWLMMPLRKR